MNLIEQLGGYEKAKEIVLSNPKTSTHYNLNSLGGHYAKEGVLKLNHRWQWFNTIDKKWYWDFSESNHIEIHDIKKSLLEYRRQHNIYEAGDICKLKTKHDFGLYKFRRIEGDRACLEDRLGFAEFWINKDVVEHATDAEIKAGKRL